MAKTLRNSQIRRDRRGIMALLRMCYPGSMEGEEVYTTIVDSNPTYERSYLVKDMNYLHEKGYVSFRGNAGIDVMRISVQDCSFKLTAKGTEVADQIVDDPALDI